MDKREQVGWSGGPGPRDLPSPSTLGLRGSLSKASRAEDVSGIPACLTSGNRLDCLPTCKTGGRGIHNLLNAYCHVLLGLPFIL